MKTNKGRCFTKDIRGQAVLESTLAIVFVVAAVGGLLTTIYLSLLKTWVTHVAYETTICLAKDLSQNTCRRKGMRQIQTLNFFSFPTRFDLQRTSDDAVTTISMEYLPSRYFKVGQKINLPLKPESL